MYLAITAAVTFGACTSVVVEGVTASASMLARIRLAFVNVEFTPSTSVAFRTIANKLVNTIFATATVHARIGFAFVDIAQAAGVKITTGTIAFESVDQVRAFAYERNETLFLRNMDKKNQKIKNKKTTTDIYLR